MAIILALTGFLLLVAAGIIFLMNRRTGKDGTNAGSTRRGIIILVVLGLVFAFASTLPAFKV